MINNLIFLKYSKKFQQHNSSYKNLKLFSKTKNSIENSSLKYQNNKLLIVPKYSRIVKSNPSWLNKKRFISNKSTEQNTLISMWKKWTAEESPKEIWSKSWLWDKFIVCVVFGITGTTTMFFVRPILRDLLQIQGTIIQGPWSYRISYFLTIMPIYSIILVLVGTLFGKSAFFTNFVKKMWLRFIPKSMLK